MDSLPVDPPVTSPTAGKPRAVLYRMALPDHLCPSGQKARDRKSVV